MGCCLAPCRSRLDKCRHRTKIAALMTSSLQPPVFHMAPPQLTCLPLPPILFFCPYSLASDLHSTNDEGNEGRRRGPGAASQPRPIRALWRFHRLSCSVLLSCRRHEVPFGNRLSGCAYPQILTNLFQLDSIKGIAQLLFASI